MADDRRYVQLEDGEGMPIAPFTYSRGVSMANGTDFQDQCAYMSVEHVAEEEINALNELNRYEEEAINAIHNTGSGFTGDIAELQDDVVRLDRQVFPLEISAKITPNFNTYTNLISFTIKEYDTGTPKLTSVYVDKSVNGGDPERIFTPTEVKSRYEITSRIMGKYEKFEFHAETEYKEGDLSTGKYMCFYGNSPLSAMTSESILALTGKTMTETVAFNPTVKTNYGDYIWLVVPKGYMTIKKVLNDGWNVTLKDGGPDTVNVGTFGSYLAYRTLNALDKATWSLTIS